jgi:hypothetical protein
MLKISFQERFIPLIPSRVSFSGFSFFISLLRLGELVPVVAQVVDEEHPQILLLCGFPFLL